MRPQQRVDALGAEHLLGREIQQDGAEQRLRDADAAQDEILPPRLEAAGVRYSVTSSTVDSVAASIATHSRPMLLVVSATSIVAMKSWYMLWYRRRRRLLEAAVLELDAHVRTREHRGGEADERGQRDQEDVEGVDEELLASGDQVALAR